MAHSRVLPLFSRYWIDVYPPFLLDRGALMSPFPIFVRLNPVRVWPNRGHSQLCSLDGTRFSPSFSLSRVRSTPGHSTPLLSSPLPLVVEDLRLRTHKDPSASLHRMRIWDREGGRRWLEWARQTWVCTLRPLMTRLVLVL